MCEMLNTEPDEEQVPIDRSDLYIETQMVLDIYDKLPSRWEGMSGQYLGKELMLLPILFDEYDTENYIRRYAWDIIPIIDNFVAKDVAEQIKARSKGAPSGG